MSLVLSLRTFRPRQGDLHPLRPVLPQWPRCQSGPPHNHRACWRMTSTAFSCLRLSRSDRCYRKTPDLDHGLVPADAVLAHPVSAHPGLLDPAALEGDFLAPGRFGSCRSCQTDTETAACT